MGKTEAQKKYCRLMDALAETTAEELHMVQEDKILELAIEIGKRRGSIYKTGFMVNSDNELEEVRYYKKNSTNFVSSFDNEDEEERLCHGVCDTPLDAIHYAIKSHCIELDDWLKCAERERKVLDKLHKLEREYDGSI